MAEQHGLTGTTRTPPNSIMMDVTIMMNGAGK
jgi:hypothetical protein